MPSRRRQYSHPWLIRVPEEFYGKTYGVFAEACLQNGLGYRVESQTSPASTTSTGGRGWDGGKIKHEAVLPLGLYRMREDLELRFAFTNPEKARPLPEP